MKVTQLINDKGNPVANHFVINKGYTKRNTVVVASLFNTIKNELLENPESKIRTDLLLLKKMFSKL